MPRTITGKRFSVYRSVLDRWGGRRVVVVEHEPDDPPSRIDARSPKIKHIIKVWQWYEGLGSKMRLTGWHAGTEAQPLATKLDSIWPMHFAAVELNRCPIHLNYVTRLKSHDELKWLLNIVKKLMPRGKEWLLKRQLITLDANGVPAFTEKGIAHFRRKPMFHNGKRARLTEGQRRELAKRYIEKVPNAQLMAEYGCSKSYAAMLAKRYYGSGSRQTQVRRK